MSDNLRFFPGVTEIAPPPLAPGEPSKRVIEAIEEMLVDAKSGRLVAFAAALVSSDNHVGSSIVAGDNQIATHLLTASIAYLHHDIISGATEGLELIVEPEATGPDPA